MSTNTTLRDVARLAGVSLGTASQALNNRANVLPETRARVLGAASSLGYSVRGGDRSVQVEPLTVIGMLTKDTGMPVEINPFFSHVQYGVESECRARNISLMYANIEMDDSNHPIVWPRMISDRHVDGLILVGANIDGLVGGLNRILNKPIVLVDSYVTSDIGGKVFDSVLMDNAPGVQAATNRLLDLGHCHIGLIGWNTASPPDICERRDGYLQALRSRAISDSYIEEGKMSRHEGYLATHRLLRRAPQITAIVATNDDTAIGVMHAVHDIGLQVPHDLSIVGFDDIDLASEVKPALSTVHVHKTWLGKLGVQFLVARAQNPSQPQLTLTVATKYIERESVARPTTSKEVIGAAARHP